MGYTSINRMTLVRELGASRAIVVTVYCDELRREFTNRFPYTDSDDAVLDLAWAWGREKLKELSM
jgi:hypothetical protein